LRSCCWEGERKKRKGGKNELPLFDSKFPHQRENIKKQFFSFCLPLLSRKKGGRAVQGREGEKERRKETEEHHAHLFLNVAITPVKTKREKK